MGFFKQVMFVLLDPRGRLKRGQFWMAWVIVLLFGIGLTNAKQDTGTIFLFITYLYLALTIYGKRLHDIGRSAWRIVWPILFHLVLVILSAYIVQQMFEASLSGNRVDYNTLVNVSEISSVLPLLVWTIFALFVGFPQGQRGANRYGLDPREERALAAEPGAVPG